MKTLRDKATVGLLWMVGSSVSSTLSKLISLMVLARLLVPNEFGAAAIGILTGTIVCEIAKLGVSHAIVRLPEITIRHKAAGFQIGLISGFSLSILVYSVSNGLEQFLNILGISLLIKLIAILPVFVAIGQVSQGILERSNRLKHLAIIRSISQITSHICIAIPLAFAGFGPVSIIVSFVMAGIIRVVGDLLLARPVFALYVPITYHFDLLRFGMGVAFSNILQSAAYNIDNLIIGKFLGGEALGIYSRSFQVVTMPTKLIGQALSTVMYPIMVQVQDNHKTLFNSVTKAFIGSLILILPFKVFLIVAAPEIIWFLLGANWNSVITPMQFLTTAVFARVAGKIFFSLVLAKGASFALMILQGLYVILVFIGAVSGSFYDVNHAAFGVAIAINLYFIIILLYACRLCEINLRLLLSMCYNKFLLFATIGVILWQVATMLRMYEVNPMSILFILFTLLLLAIYASTRAFPAIERDYKIVMKPILNKIMLKNDRQIK